MREYIPQRTYISPSSLTTRCFPKSWRIKMESDSDGEGKDHEDEASDF